MAAPQSAAKPRSSGEGLGQDTGVGHWDRTAHLCLLLPETGFAADKGSDSPGSCRVAFIQLPGGRGPWAGLAAEETMERKALISR